MDNLPIEDTKEEITRKTGTAVCTSTGISSEPFEWEGVGDLKTETFAASERTCPMSSSILLPEESGDGERS
jgi:hypothetical protein